MVPVKRQGAPFMLGGENVMVQNIHDTRAHFKAPTSFTLVVLGGFLVCLLCFVLFFKGRTCSIQSFPGQGLNQSCSHWPVPQPQQHQIRATSSTYTTTHGNAGSLTHWRGHEWVKDLSWMLGRFVSTEPRGTPPSQFYF